MGFGVFFGILKSIKRDEHVGLQTGVDLVQPLDHGDAQGRKKYFHDGCLLEMAPPGFSEGALCIVKSLLQGDGQVCS